MGFWYIDWKVKDCIDPGPKVSLEASLLIENNTVGEQITVEQLIEKRKVMTISKAMIMKYRYHVRVKQTETILHLEY